MSTNPIPAFRVVGHGEDARGFYVVVGGTIDLNTIVGSRVLLDGTLARVRSVTMREDGAVLYLHPPPSLRGLAFLTCGRDARNLLVGASGDNREVMVQACFSAAEAQGGSLHPEDWMAWELDCTPTPELLADIERRVASGEGGASHPAVIGTIFDARHPKIAARGNA